LDVLVLISWSGAAVKNLSEFAHHMSWKMVEQTVEEKQGLKKDNYELCLKLGHQVASLLIDTQQKNN